ncbi:MAG: alcohol dehydrogenase catalytic domain-containing protein [Ignavibacteriota bacterium]
MPSNEAAWLVAKHAPLQVREAPYPEPGAGEVVVKNHAVAVNPVDWMKPYVGDLIFSYIKYPFVLGSDLAGEVVAIGGGVTDVKVGDRVLAMAAGACRQRNRAAEGAFQAYTIVLPRLTTIIPEHLSYAEAAVVPPGRDDCRLRSVSERPPGARAPIRTAESPRPMGDRLGRIDQRGQQRHPTRRGGGI